VGLELFEEHKIKLEHIEGGMPSLSYKDKEGVSRARIKEQPTAIMPQPVTVSIALGPDDPEKVGNINDSSHELERNIAAGGKHPHPSIPGNSTGSISTSGVANCNDNNNVVANTTLLAVPPLPPSRPPIKRTKKVAKPKPKAKKVPSTNAKKLPKKKAKANAASTKPTPPSRKKGGKTTSSSARKSPLPKKNQTDKIDSKAKSKRPKFTEGKPAKKRARKKKSQDPVVDNPSLPQSQETKEKASKRPPDVAKSDQEQEMMLSILVNKDSKLETVVSAVVDTLALEIRYCAFRFGTKHPQVVITSKDEDSPDTKNSRNLPTDNLEDLNPSKKCASSLEIGSSSIVSNKLGVAVLSPSYDVHISQGDNLHPVKNDKHISKSRKYANSSNKKHSTSPPKRGPSVSEMYNVSTVVLAVQRFAMEVYFPFLHSANMNMENSSPDYDRIQVSTFIAIREMLIMNADKLFTFPATQGSSTDQARKERFFASRVLANAIVRNAAKRLHLRNSGSHFFADFIQATQNYDARTDDFQFSLTRAGAQSEYSCHDGKAVGRQESILARVGFNYARERHPLLHSTQDSSKDDENKGSSESKRAPMQHPVPSACAAFHIEVESDYTSDEVDDEAALMKSLKNVLKRKSST
jgi:hypothetical protein